MLASDIYAVQLGSDRSRQARRRQGPLDALRALQRRGGVANYAVIAQATAMPVGRVAGFVAIVARVLNVDGFGVLTIDATAQEARLDETLLRSQFLDGGS